MAGNPHTPLGLFKCCDINRKNVPNSPFIEKKKCFSIITIGTKKKTTPQTN